MSGNKKNIKSNLVQVDAHRIQPEEYDELPELSDEMLLRADYYDGGTRIRRGRPQSEKVTEAVSIRLDSDVLEAFRRRGKGWQARINSVLKQWVASHT